MVSHFKNLRKHGRELQMKRTFVCLCLSTCTNMSAPRANGQAVSLGSQSSPQRGLAYGCVMLVQWGATKPFGSFKNLSSGSFHSSLLRVSTSCTKALAFLSLKHVHSVRNETRSPWTSGFASRIPLRDSKLPKSTWNDLKLPKAAWCL